MSLPQEMDAVEIATFGGPEVLRPTRRPVPVPKPHEVLIKVAGAGVNRPDLIQRAGRYPPPPGASDLPGLEVSGHVVACGGEVSGWAVGDAVCALVAGGGYAEYTAAPAIQCLKPPAGLDLVEAGAIVETGFTVWSNLIERGRYQPGESLLVHGGTSGIGSMGIQVGKAMGGKVLATAGSADKVAFCSEIGADRAINYRDEDFVAVVKEETGGKGVDVILDIVGGAYFARNVEALAEDGRLALVGVMGGVDGQVNVGLMLRKRLTVTGSTLRARPEAEKGRLAREVEKGLWPLIASGKVQSLVRARFPLAEAGKAHALMESSGHMGKVVLVTGA